MLCAPQPACQVQGKGVRRAEKNSVRSPKKRANLSSAFFRISREVTASKDFFEVTSVDVSSRQHANNLRSLWNGNFLGKKGRKPGCS
jgi:hypothetical protein